MKRIIPFILIAVLLLIIKSIIESIVTLQQNSQIVQQLKTEKDTAIKRQEFLSQELYYVKTNDFIENEAREKLGMVKPGEHVILIPPTSANSAPTKKEENIPNWEKWRRLFF